MPARAQSPFGYAGEVPVVVVTAAGHPSFLVARSSFGQPRAVFVDYLVKRQYGTQPGGTPHEWHLVEEQEEAPEQVDVPVDNPKVHDWLRDKVNGC